MTLMFKTSMSATVKINQKIYLHIFYNAVLVTYKIIKIKMRLNLTVTNNSVFLKDSSIARLSDNYMRSCEFNILHNTNNKDKML